MRAAGVDRHKQKSDWHQDMFPVLHSAAVVNWQGSLCCAVVDGQARELAQQAADKRRLEDDKQRLKERLTEVAALAASLKVCSDAQGARMCIE